MLHSYSQTMIRYKENYTINRKRNKNLLELVLILFSLVKHAQVTLHMLQVNKK